MARYIIRPTSVGLLSRGKDYSVRDLGNSPAGYTDLLRKELGVSLAADAPQTRWTQLHELFHVKDSMWSPGRIQKRMAKVGKKLSIGAILAAEDARINERGTRKVPDAHDGFALAVAPEKLRQDIEGYVASHASPVALADAIRPACAPDHVAAVDAWLARLPRMATRDLSVLRVTVPLAQLIDDLKAGKAPESGDDEGEGGGGEGEGKPGGDGAEGEPMPVPPKPRPGDGPDDGEDEPGEPSEDDEDAREAAGGDEDEPGADGADTDGDEDTTDADADEGADDGGGDAETDDREAFGPPDAHKAKAGKGCARVMPADDGSGHMAPWLIPEVVEPELTVPMRGGNFQVTTAESGNAVRWSQLHRIQTDGVIFRRNRRRPGALQRGTVLIDVSGSMSFTDASLTAVVEMLPHATVAVYSGGVFVNAQIVVVARNGRRVARLADTPSRGGNTCDGPALLWLSRQPAPRLWICDGEVTGSGDVPESWQREECTAIMKAAGIVQVTGGRGYPSEDGLRAVRTLTMGYLSEATQRNLPAMLAPVLKDVERGRI